MVRCLPTRAGTLPPLVEVPEALAEGLETTRTRAPTSPLAQRRAGSLPCAEPSRAPHGDEANLYVVLPDRARGHLTMVSRLVANAPHTSTSVRARAPDHGFEARR